MLRPTDGGLRVDWQTPQRRVAPGQSVVFYDLDDRCVHGGGIARTGFPTAIRSALTDLRHQNVAGMEGYRPETYGERIADVYDELFGDLGDVPANVSFLDGLVAERPARILELAVGTGRLAIPLAASAIT